MIDVLSRTFVVVSLEGISRFAQVTPHKFTGFFITVEKDHSEARQAGLKGDEDTVGRFHITSSATSKFSEKCQDLVTHTSSFPKNEILVNLKTFSDTSKTFKIFL